MATTKRRTKGMEYQAVRLVLAALLATAAPIVVPQIAGPAAAQQNHQMSERAERIVRSLRPAARSRYSDSAYIQRIIEMEIPLPHKRGSQAIRLNYNHSIDLAVYYDFDSAKITGETADVLDDLGAALATSELDGSRYLVAGHTNSAGSEGYNQWLSERRALSAKRYLVEHYRINPERLVVVGFGETRLADRRRPKDGINRRVEITLIADDYSGPTSEHFRAPDTTYVPRGGDEPTAEELGLVEYDAPSSGAIDCDAASRLRDPRPARTGLDDFGSRRTPVPCGEEPETVAAPAAPVDLPPVAEPQAPSEPEDPAAGQNSAIQN